MVDEELEICFELGETYSCLTHHSLHSKMQDLIINIDRCQNPFQGGFEMKRT